MPGREATSGYLVHSVLHDSDLLLLSHVLQLTSVHSVYTGRG